MERNGQIGPAQHSYSQMIQTPLDLDYLIYTLRSPTPDTSVLKVLGYIYHYIPYVKVEHNLRVILSSFLNNQVCFGNNIPSYEDNYLIIEVFKLITDKKLKVSKPTLSIKTYYEVLLKELENFVAYDPLRNSWKVMPIICGLWLSNDLRDELYTDNNVLEYKWFFYGWDDRLDTLFKKCLKYSLSDSAPPNITNLVLISLALKFKTGENLDEYLGNIQRKLVISKLTTLLFDKGTSDAYKLFATIGPNDPNWDLFIKTNVLQRPVIKHLNRLAFLLESLLRDLPYNDENFHLIMDLVNRMLEFNRDLNYFTASQPLLNTGSEAAPGENSYQVLYLILMKSFLFFQVIVFQGILSRFVSVKNVSLMYLLLRPRSHVSRIEYEYREIGRMILHSLYYLNFILMDIGLGGFDGYNFVYYVCLEICIQNNRDSSFEQFTRYLIGNYKEVNLHHQALNHDYVLRCKVFFVLGLWENYLQMVKDNHTHSDPEFVEFIYATTIDKASNPYINDYMLVEALHSVLLVYFSSKQDTSKALGQVLNYFEVLATQFPRILSANQLSVAVETLGKKILSTPVIYGTDSLYRNSAEEFLEFIYFKCQNTMPGLPIRTTEVTVLTSAQPIQEVDAASTMSQLARSSLDHTDIIKENKMQKPKDLPGLSLIPSGEAKEQFTKREVPNTSREALIVAFIHIIPYLPMTIFIHWLDRMWSLIVASNHHERVYLTEKLWHVLSNNLDFNRCQIAYPWWYETRQAVEKDIGQALKL